MIDTTEANLYKIGSGSAQVWGENKGLRALQMAQQQDQLRRQKEDAELNEQVAKINYDAARPEDLPQILKQYQGIKNTFAKIRGTQNAMDRIKLMTDLNQQKSDLSRGVALSKQAGQQLGELGKLRLSKPDDISDDFVGNYKTLSGLSVFDPKFKELADTTASTALVPAFNANLFNKSILDRSIKQIEGGDYQKMREKGMDVYRKKEGTELNSDNVLKNAINSYTTDRSFRRFIDREFKDMPVEEAIKTYAANLYTANKDAYNKVKNIDKTQFDQRVSPMTEYQRYRIANGLDGGGSESGNVQDIVIPYGKGGSANVSIPEYVPVSVSKKNFAGSEAIDLKTGKPIGKLSSSNDYEIVGVGNVPFITKGNFKGAISQPDFTKSNPDAINYKPVIHVQIPAKGDERAKDYFIPYDRLPENVKNSKSIKEALVKFKPATAQKQNTTSRQSQKKVIKGF